MISRSAEKSRELAREVVVIRRSTDALAQQFHEVGGAAPGTDSREIMQVFTSDQLHSVVAQPCRFARREKRLRESACFEQPCQARPQIELRKECL